VWVLRPLLTVAHAEGLDKVVLLEVELEDRVLDRREHEPNIFRICGTREVGVDNFFRVRVEVDEHPEDVFPGVDGVPLGTVIFWKVVD